MVFIIRSLGLSFLIRQMGHLTIVSQTWLLGGSSQQGPRGPSQTACHVSSLAYTTHVSPCPRPHQLLSVPHTCHATAHHRAFARAVPSAWSTLTSPLHFCNVCSSLSPMISSPILVLLAPVPHLLNALSIMNDNVYLIVGVFG